MFSFIYLFFKSSLGFLFFIQLIEISQHLLTVGTHRKALIVNRLMLYNQSAYICIAI